MVAIDGSTFRAVNSTQRNVSATGLERLVRGIDTRIATYLQDMEARDHQEAATRVGPTAAELQQTIAALRERRTRYTTLQAQLAASTETQISLTDPESRSMKVRGGVDVCYTVQTAVDAKHKLIVAADVTNDATDRAGRSPMATAANTVLGAADLHVVADQGYYNGPEITACAAAGITATVPRPHTSANAKHGLFTTEDFAYDAAADQYRCPAGEALTYRFSTVERERGTRYYSTKACGRCALKPRCTRNKASRRITRWEDAGVLDAMAKRLAEQPERYARRKAIVEHPCRAP